MDSSDEAGRISEDRALELLEELVARWRNNDRSFLTMSVRDHQVVSLVMFGLTVHAVNLCASLTSLYRAGEHAAIPALTRQVIELSTTAVWVEMYGSTTAEALMAEHSRQQLSELNAFIDLGMAGGEVALAAAGNDKKWFLAHAAGKYFEQRCSELEGGATIYAVYRAASQYSHATTAVVDSYLREASPDSRAPVALTSTPRDYARPWLLAALTMLVHAGLAFDRLHTGHPDRRRLREIAGEIGVGTKWSPSVVGARAQRERVRAERNRRRSRTQRP